MRHKRREESHLQKHQHAKRESEDATLESLPSSACPGTPALATVRRDRCQERPAEEPPGGARSVPSSVRRDSKCLCRGTEFRGGLLHGHRLPPSPAPRLTSTPWKLRQEHVNPKRENRRRRGDRVQGGDVTSPWPPRPAPRGQTADSQNSTSVTENSGVFVFQSYSPLQNYFPKALGVSTDALQHHTVQQFVLSIQG